MAKIDDVFLSGKMDNIVVYYRQGIKIARSIPVNVRQSAQTIKCKNNFGRASTIGSTLRRQLLPALHFPKEKLMQSNFSGAIFKWLGPADAEKILPVDKIIGVNHFDFNTKTSVSNRLKVSINVIQSSVSNVEIHIPAFVPITSIKAPANTSAVELIIAMGSCRLINGENMGDGTVTISIPYNDTLIEAQVISFNVSAERGSLVVTAASLRYTLTNGRKDNRISFLPSSVIDARLF